ncbi:lysosomal alpha-glucosidase [Galendromus occidentalis]|uniref:Lysosomal alpha-glucosidase n=1 Tax=Galendromus occidentalis TaxID=34638 RepID=A0AAJ6VWU2_9ACAR|nr:lysosomal alpha-glucosidase [Galendromus occidentalis]
MRSVLLAAGFLALTSALQCDIQNAIERIDCLPERNSNEQRCHERGCCWKTRQDGDPHVNFPYCFYPRDYSGYVISNQTQDRHGATVYLQRQQPSHSAQDIGVLRVEVRSYSNQIVRIRIVDPHNQRWEPPYPAIPPPSSRIDSPIFDFEITQDSRLEVRRFDGDQGDNHKVKLVSLNLGTMIYTDRFIQVTSLLPSNVVYGLGEHHGSLRRSMDYSRFTFYNEDQPPVENKRLYGTQPFYINLESDGRANGMWLLNSNAMDILLQPAPAITYRPTGGVLDFFIFAGPSPADVVKQYQDIVGRPKMIPYWSLGFHLCRYGYKSTEDTRRTLQRNLDAGVRIDVQWNDIDYMDKFNGFTLDPENYSDLGKLADELHKDGRHYVMIVDPAVSGSETPGSYPPYDRGLEQNVFVKTAKGRIVEGRVWNLGTSVFPDFTHPNATIYWTELFRDFHKRVAYDGAWIDMNEPSNGIDGHNDDNSCRSDQDMPYVPGDVYLHKRTICTSDVHHLSSHYNVHNLYAYAEAISTYKALTAVAPNKRPFIISRSTFSGQGFYSGHWTGDIYSNWGNLKDSISGILDFSFYGIPMVGADICGFLQDTTTELCARWQALGAFYPFSRNHNNIQAKDQDPAALGETVLKPTRNAFYWRYKLLPYLYTLFYGAHMDGETVARPLFFEYPEDPKTYDNDRQFMWGRALMVVPALFENQKIITGYFPKGIWYDLQNRTGTVDATSGGKYVDLPADMDYIHFFMKGGNAVFFQEPGNTTTDSRKSPFGLYVFLDDGVASGRVFLDDGESIDSITSGEFDVVHAMATKDILVVSNRSQMKSFYNLDEVHVYGIKSQPKEIFIDRAEFIDFVYDEQRQLLTMNNLNHDMTLMTVSFVY